MTLDLAIRSLLKDVVREVVREELGARPSQTSEFLTYAEAAELGHVSLATIKRWVRIGYLRAFGEGRVRRVRSEDVRACIEGAAKPLPAANDKVASILASVRGPR